MRDFQFRLKRKTLSIRIPALESSFQAVGGTGQARIARLMLTAKLKQTGTSTLTQRNKMAALEDKAIWEDGEVILTAYVSAEVRYKCLNKQ